MGRAAARETLHLQHGTKPESPTTLRTRISGISGVSSSSSRVKRRAEAWENCDWRPSRSRIQGRAGCSCLIQRLWELLDKNSRFPNTATVSSQEPRENPEMEAQRNKRTFRAFEAPLQQRRPPPSPQGWSYLSVDDEEEDPAPSHFFSARARIQPSHAVCLSSSHQQQLLYFVFLPFWFSENHGDLCGMFGIST